MAIRITASSRFDRGVADIGLDRHSGALIESEVFGRETIDTCICSAAVLRLRAAAVVQDPDTTVLKRLGANRRGERRDASVLLASRVAPRVVDLDRIVQPRIPASRFVSAEGAVGGGSSTASGPLGPADRVQFRGAEGGPTWGRGVGEPLLADRDHRLFERGGNLVEVCADMSVAQCGADLFD